MNARSYWPARMVEPRALMWMAGFVAGAAAIYLAALAWTGWSAVSLAFGQIGWPPLLAGACIASLGYLVRFVRWHYTLSSLGSPLRVNVNLPVYLAGLALTATPGKAGETVRSVFLMPFGVPVERTLGAFLADRVSDVVGVCLLGALAGCAAHGSLNVVGVFGIFALAVCLVLRAVVRRPALGERLNEKLPAKLRDSGRLSGGALLQWAEIWKLQNALIFSAIAAFAYGLQAGVFAWFCSLLSITLTFAEAIELYVNAMLLGAASMVPGGLGTMEAALVAQLTARGASFANAVSVAIATRLATLWVGLIIGISALLWVGKRGRAVQ